ncbi:hypothetical protein DL96DRAFT_1620521 [Flagelloscypha sp. PMI_526]|nr:hypothetical protein DL96DRAFT_1620521 [Flagelloscypha sp. PMI_526]
MAYRALSSSYTLTYDETNGRNPRALNHTSSNGDGPDEFRPSNCENDSLCSLRNSADWKEDHSWIDKSPSLLPVADSAFDPLPQQPVHKWHLMCIILHATFALMHFALIGIMVSNSEKNVRITLENTARWKTGLQIGLQSFAVIYLSTVLFITQKLYQQRTLVTQQTLTKSHDESASWFGLGSAISSLYKQRSARSGPFTILGICVYLLASAIVKITTSALFQLPTVSVPDTVAVNATSRDPVSAGYPLEEKPAWVEGYSRDPDTGPLQQILMSIAIKEWDNFTTPSLRSTVGLQDNTLYDIIPSVLNTTGPTEVNSYAVEVHCHSATESEIAPLGQLTFGNGVLFAFSENGGAFTTVNAAAYTNRSTVFPFISLLTVVDSNNQPSHPLPLKMLSFQRINGGIFDYASTLNISPQVDSMFMMCPQGVAMTLEIGRSLPNLLFNVTQSQTLMCSANVIPGKSLLDPQTKKLISKPARKNSSFWADMPPGLRPVNDSDSMYPVFPETKDRTKRDGPYAKLWCNLTTTSPDALKAAYSSGGALPSHGSTYLLPQFFELYLLSKLTPFRNVSSGVERLIEWTPPPLQLFDVEKALEDYIGLYFWTYQQAAENTLPGQFESRTTTLVSIPITTQISQLTLVALPVYVGLIASLVMFAIALWITATTPVRHCHVDGLGLLQVLWLANSTVTPVSRPTEGKLRKAGMAVDVRLHDSVEPVRKGASSVIS